ncbi:DUF305 domain-containing protein [Alteromonas sp. ASW11-36]|uniref:DUF305 domain-containing protein n=1 Tax=Alteromonas arenosi TaxID=3055817 RepID=A0ABT7SW00_9ALTE|nr:DUF305 domain-containing protein [Alteromonas sp. ASW11-36]MDM7860345.1 DUF305 domain-containing protein [Alteromonas sp. ASW11-36]
MKNNKRPLISGLTLLAIAVSSGLAVAQDAPIVQPGAPGQETRDLSAEQAIQLSKTRYTLADVSFMQNMIPHHAQAVEMAELVAERTNNEKIIDIAGRIQKSQTDEIGFMRDWLQERGEAIESPHHMHMDHAMMGMATAAQMQQLAESTGVDFDRQFLDLMIPHHEGAVRMVNDLLSKDGSAYDPLLYDFVNDIVNDQNAEITRMNEMLAGLSGDPRVGLVAGLHDAGSAIMNLTLTHSLPKPRGFFDPENPANLPPVKPTEESDEASNESRDEDLEGGDVKTEWGERWPLLSFWNTDMAFANDVLVAGNYHGFNVYKISNDAAPQLMSSIVCPGGQGDVSIVGDLLIMSVEQTRGRIDCGLQGVDEDVSDERFRGLRIFDISDLTRPQQVGLVQTCRGSHTHSIVSADDERVVVYNSGTAGVRDEEELAGCVGDVPGDERTALFRIDVIEIPIDNPAAAKITSSPAVFADPEGRVAGLWLGGDHGDDTQTTRRTDQCHDITIFPSANLAAGACSGNGIILDISDPLNPQRIDEVTDPGFAYWHSATFNNDGTKVLFTDEWGGGIQPRCRASDPKSWGANAIYEIVDGKLEFQSYYKIDAPQSEQENCVAHNGSIIPVPGRDIFAQAWYQGGLSVIDFTATEPVEIAYFDRGPIHEERRVVAGYWSTYWYNGKIYGTEIIRGLDVFDLQPSEYLSANEIAAAKLADMGDVFNPQQQLPVTWPDVPVVALAYLDQLERHGLFANGQRDEIDALLSQADEVLQRGEGNLSLSRKLATVTATLTATQTDTAAQSIIRQLEKTLIGIMSKLEA